MGWGNKRHCLLKEWLKSAFCQDSDTLLRVTLCVICGRVLYNQVYSCRKKVRSIVLWKRELPVQIWFLTHWRVHSSLNSTIVEIVSQNFPSKYPSGQRSVNIHIWTWTGRNSDMVQEANLHQEFIFRVNLKADTLLVCLFYQEGLLLWIMLTFSMHGLSFTMRLCLSIAALFPSSCSTFFLILPWKGQD